MWLAVACGGFLWLRRGKGRRFRFEPLPSSFQPQRQSFPRAPASIPSSPELPQSPFQAHTQSCSRPGTENIPEFLVLLAQPRTKKGHSSVQASAEPTDRDCRPLTVLADKPRRPISPKPTSAKPLLLLRMPAVNHLPSSR
jgi:hypothetical protein